MNEPYNDAMWIYLDDISVPILVDTKNIIKLKSIKRKWFLSKLGYIYCCVQYKGKQFCIYLHKWLLGQEGKYPKDKADHINRDKFDYRIENLRECTQQQNSFNTGKKHKNSKSKFKGIWFDKRRNLWVAEIMKDYKKRFLGYFKHEIDAAKAYDKAAIELFGEFALTNKQLGLL